MSRPPKSGGESGDVVDVPLPAGDGDDLMADDMLAIIDEFDRSDAGRTYRLVLGHLNLRVIAGNFIAWPTPLSSPDERIAVAGFDWWGQAGA